MRFGIRGKTYEINKNDVLSATKGNAPDGFDGRYRYYVELDGLKYSIKQIIHLTTKLPKSEFHAGDAKRILEKLGFSVKLIQDTNEVGQGSIINTTTDTVGGTIKLAVTLRSGEDGFIIASAPALPGCYSQGRTEEEAIHNIKEAIRGYVASLRKHGEPVPSMTKVREVEVTV